MKWKPFYKGRRRSLGFTTTELLVGVITSAVVIAFAVGAFLLFRRTVVESELKRKATEWKISITDALKFDLDLAQRISGASGEDTVLPGIYRAVASDNLGAKAGIRSGSELTDVLVIAADPIGNIRAKVTMDTSSTSEGEATVSFRTDESQAMKDRFKSTMKLGSIAYFLNSEFSNLAVVDAEMNDQFKFSVAHDGGHGFDKKEYSANTSSLTVSPAKMIAYFVQDEKLMRSIYAKGFGVPADDPSITTRQISPTGVRVKKFLINFRFDPWNKSGTSSAQYVLPGPNQLLSHPSEYYTSAPGNCSPDPTAERYCCDPTSPTQKCVKLRDISRVQLTLALEADANLKAGTSVDPNAGFEVLENGNVVYNFSESVAPVNFVRNMVAMEDIGESTECSIRNPSSRCKPECAYQYANGSLDPSQPNWKGYGAYAGRPESEGGASAYCMCGTPVDGINWDANAFSPPETWNWNNWDAFNLDEVRFQGGDVMHAGADSRRVRACLEHFGASFSIQGMNYPGGSSFYDPAMMGRELTPFKFIFGFNCLREEDSDDHTFRRRLSNGDAAHDSAPYAQWEFKWNAIQQMVTDQKAFLPNSATPGPISEWMKKRMVCGVLDRPTCDAHMRWLAFPSGTPTADVAQGTAYAPWRRKCACQFVEDWNVEQSLGDPDWPNVCNLTGNPCPGTWDQTEANNMATVPYPGNASNQERVWKMKDEDMDPPDDTTPANDPKWENLLHFPNERIARYCQCLQDHQATTGYTVWPYDAEFRDFSGPSTRSITGTIDGVSRTYNVSVDSRMSKLSYKKRNGSSYDASVTADQFHRCDAVQCELAPGRGCCSDPRQTFQSLGSGALAGLTGSYSVMEPAHAVVGADFSSYCSGSCYSPHLWHPQENPFPYAREAITTGPTIPNECRPIPAPPAVPVTPAD